MTSSKHAFCLVNFHSDMAKSSMTADGLQCAPEDAHLCVIVNASSWPIHYQKIENVQSV